MSRDPQLYQWTDTVSTHFPHLSKPQATSLALWSFQWACHVEGMSIREASRVFGVYRKPVRKILQFSIPPRDQRLSEPKRPEPDSN